MKKLQIDGIVNIYKEECTTYIGRARAKDGFNPWGNPFPRGNLGKRAVIAQHMDYLLGYEEYNGATGISLLDSIEELDGETLGCFCKPKRCHGDNYVQIMKWVNNREIHEHVNRNEQFTCFVSGSMSIKELTPLMQESLDRVFTTGSTRLLVGDAKGVDTMVQWHSGYANATVYHMGREPRNNHKELTTVKVPSGNLTGRAYYTQKDIQMTNDADELLVIWDGKSTGSLANIHRGIAQNKNVYLIYPGAEKVVLIRTEEDFINLKK